MTTKEWNRLAPFAKAKSNAPKWNGTSRRTSKKPNAGLHRGRYISQRGYAKI